MTASAPERGGSTAHLGYYPDSSPQRPVDFRSGRSPEPPPIPLRSAARKRIEYGAWGPGAVPGGRTALTWKGVANRIEACTPSTSTVVLVPGPVRLLREDGNGASRCDPTGKGRGVDDCRPVKLRLCGCAGNAACDLHWRADRQYSSSLVEQRAPHAAASFRRVIGGFAGGVVQPDGPHRARAPHHATLRPDRPGGGAAGGRVPWSAIRARCRASRSPCATDSPECCGARRQSVPRVRWCCRYYRETAAASARSQAYSDSRVARASVFGIFHAGKRSARDPHAAFMHRP